LEKMWSIMDMTGFSRSRSIGYTEFQRARSVVHLPKSRSGLNGLL
jgi:hypothetical protein